MAQTTMNKEAWSTAAGLLSIVCCFVALFTMPDGRGDSLAFNISALACFALCIAAGILGSKQWWWLILVYVVLLFVDMLSHLSFGF